MNSIQSFCHYYNKLIGWLKITATDNAVTNIDFVRAPDNPIAPSGHHAIDNLIIELDRYFQKTNSSFITPIRFTEGTKFQQTVWKELLKIPVGQTRSYGQIAAALGNPKAARAVGSANAKNPLPIVVPCHRVINSNGSLGGYSSGIDIKRALLNLEKANFRDIPSETEAKLVIISNDPKAIVNKLSRLRNLGDFLLGPSRVHQFQDTYFDSPDRRLGVKMWALRLRRYDEGEKVTMKGPAQQFSDGSLKRPEFEIEWKNNSLKRILDLIQDIGVSLSSTLSGQNVDPELSIRSIGLDVIQKRDTCRTSRKIFDSKHSESIAQLDIDQVSFMCRGRKFTHYEIEIETRAPEDCPVIKKSLEYLKRRFGEFVRLWTLDKLTTVQLICDLFESGNLIGIGPGALLTSSAYEKVHEEFDRRM